MSFELSFDARGGLYLHSWRGIREAMIFYSTTVGQDLLIPLVFQFKSHSYLWYELLDYQLYPEGNFLYTRAVTVHFHRAGKEITVCQRTWNNAHHGSVDAERKADTAPSTLMEAQTSLRKCSFTQENTKTALEIWLDRRKFDLCIGVE